MKPRRVAIQGGSQDSVREGIEDVARVQSRRETIVEYDVASGSNTIRHGQRALPSGRHIVYNTAGSITDTALTAESWSFTAAGAGKIKVVWL